MYIKINDLNVNYIQYGSGKDIILLHGWGQNIEMMKPLGDLLSKTHKITILDFPGFGQSDDLITDWTIHDYTDMLKEFVNVLDIKKPILIGHSFGGRVAINYSSTESISKLILFGSPCIRKNKKLSLKVRILKSLMKVPGLKNIGEYMKKYIGSRDYKAASPILRKTLVHVVNEDLTTQAKQIDRPTLLIWGEYDDESPVDEAKELEKIIEDAGLIVLPGTHYAYLENLNQVFNILKEFI